MLHSKLHLRLDIYDFLLEKVSYNGPQSWSLAWETWTNFREQFQLTGLQGFNVATETFLKWCKTN